MRKQTKNELKIRLEGMLKIPAFRFYNPNEKDPRWWITEFTKEQLFGSIKECIKVLEQEKDE